MMGPPARALIRSNSAGSIGHGGLLNPGSSEPLGEPWRSPGAASAGKLSRWGQPERDPFSEVFGAYCGADQDLDIRGFQRLCKESLLTCETLTASDVNAVFHQLVSQESGRMTRQQCEAAMQLIAQKKGVEEATVRRAVVVALGPTLRFARHGVQPAEDTRTARIDDEAARERIEQATARAQSALDAALQAGLDTEVDSLKLKAKHALHVALLGGGDAGEGAQDSVSAEQLEDVKLRARQSLHAAILGPAAEDDAAAELGDQDLEEAKANARAALNAALLENGAEGPGEFTPEELQRAKAGARAALDAVLLLESQELSNELLKGSDP